jgi:hypothetical protein
MADETLRSEAVPGESPLASEIVVGGVVSGFIGGLLMAVWGAFATLSKGLGVMAFPQMIGCTFLRPEAMLHPAATAIWGTVLHFLIACAWGVLFSALVRRETTNANALPAGLLYAVGIFLLMVFVVVPVTNQVLADRAPMMLGTLFMMHLLYGVGVSLAPSVRRRFLAATSP